MIIFLFLVFDTTTFGKTYKMNAMTWQHNKEVEFDLANRLHNNFEPFQKSRTQLA